MTGSDDSGYTPGTAEKPAVLFLFRGPKQDIDHEIGTRMRLLSADLSGVVLVPSLDEKTRRIGEFDVVTIRFTRSSSPAFNIKYLRTALRAVRSWERREGRKFDLVVTEDAMKTGFHGVLMSRMIGARLIAEVNGDYWHDANYMELRSVYKRAFKKWLFTSIQKFVLARSHAIKLLYKNQLDAYGACFNNKMTGCFFDFVDLTPFRSIANDKVVLLAGFPLYVKGVDILIEAFKMVSENHRDWKLHIIGHYPDDRELKSAINGHPRISHLRPVPHHDMPGIIGRCGIYVSASRTEAMGRVLLEAMKCGKARIASEVGGCHTVLEDKVDGLMFPSEDTDALAALLDKLMSNSDLRAQLGKNGLERAHREFMPEHYRQKIKEFYLSVIAKT